VLGRRLIATIRGKFLTFPAIHKTDVLIVLNDVRFRGVKQTSVPVVSVSKPACDIKPVLPGSIHQALDLGLC
jgi:glycosylphosphatidylinositol transamidase (GPIT) subunit GPI8